MCAVYKKNRPPQPRLPSRRANHRHQRPRSSRRTDRATQTQLKKRPLSLWSDPFIRAHIPLLCITGATHFKDPPLSHSIKRFGKFVSQRIALKITPQPYVGSMWTKIPPLEVSKFDVADKQIRSASLTPRSVGRLGLASSSSLSSSPTCYKCLLYFYVSQTFFRHNIPPSTNIMTWFPRLEREQIYQRAFQSSVNTLIPP